MVLADINYFGSTAGQYNALLLENRQIRYTSSK